MASNELDPNEVRLSIVGALLTNVTPQFRRVTFAIDGRTIDLQFLFEPPDDGELRELSEEIATEAVADFVDARVAVKIEFSNDRIAASSLPNHVFLRREIGMFEDLPGPKIMFGTGAPR